MLQGGGSVGWLSRSRVGQTLDGDEATRRLKANAVLHAIPVIAVTSYVSNRGRLR